MEERRRFMRLEASVNVEYNILNPPGPGKIDVLTKNISAGGLCLTVFEPIEPETTLGLTLHLPDDPVPISSTARVVWNQKYSMGAETKERFELGVEFLDIEDTDRERINKFVFKSSKDKRVI